MGSRASFQRTYEELKHNIKVGTNTYTTGFQRTYEELKPMFFTMRLKSIN